MDGVLVDTEHVWDEVRELLVLDWGGHYSREAQRAMMGMSSTEWSSYMASELGLDRPAEVINAEVVRRMLERYESELPVIDGAVDAVEHLAQRGRAVGLASSSNRELIDGVLHAMGIEHLFTATVSSDEVARGKPSPDVYLEVADRLGVDPATCIAVEDSTNGIRAAVAAGMDVVAFPNERFPPGRDALALATATIGSLADLAGAVGALETSV